MRAEREKREKILIAEGEKTSAITIAEGNKEATILNAEAEKQAAIKKAEAEAEAILKVKKAEADGELLIRKAEADSIRMINEANPSQAVLKMRSYEALIKASDGRETKLIIPSDATDLVTVASILTQTVQEMKQPADSYTKVKEKNENTNVLAKKAKQTEEKLHKELEKDHKNNTH